MTRIFIKLAFIMTILLDGKTIAQKKRQQLKDQIEQTCQNSLPPKLAAVLIGKDPASHIYVNNKIKACHDVGILSEVFQENEDFSEQALLYLIKSLNQDKTVSGILVQLPLPPHINPNKVIETISPLKDVDGFHPFNIGNLALRMPTLRSCTPYGIMQLLEAYDIEPRGKHAVIIGVSNNVGRPLALELLLAGSTVTSCHRHTKNLTSLIPQADILVSATGKRNVFDETFISHDATVIDIGIHRVNGKVMGDLEFDKLNGRVAHLTPVPGGVGPMTITALLHNTYIASQYEHSD